MQDRAGRVRRARLTWGQVIEAERGVTLLELLVALAISAALFGIVSMALAGLATDAEVTVYQAEHGVVQRALDLHMTDLEMTSIAARSTPAFIEAGDAAWADAHLRSLPSRCQYAWSASGETVQGDCPTATCSTSFASLILAGLAFVPRWLRGWRRPRRLRSGIDG